MVDWRRVCENLKSSCAGSTRSYLVSGLSCKFNFEDEIILRRVGYNIQHEGGADHATLSLGAHGKDLLGAKRPAL